VIYALTKTDKLNRQELERARRSMNAALGTADDVVLTSAKSGQGIKELWSAIIKNLKEPGAIRQDFDELSRAAHGGEQRRTIRSQEDSLLSAV